MIWVLTDDLPCGYCSSWSSFHDYLHRGSDRCSQRGSVELDLAVRREGWGRGESFRQREEQEDMTVVLGVTHGEQEDEGWKAH